MSTIYCIIVFLLVMFSAILPFSTILWSVTYCLIIIGIIMALILISYNRKKVQDTKPSFILLLVFILCFIVYNDLYNLEKCFIEVNNYMKNEYTNYKIISIDKKNINNDDENNYSDYMSCNYMLNVRLNDDTNITFQSGYCNVSGQTSNFKVIDNYSYYYVSYYYNKYKINNRVSFRIEKDDDKYSYKSIKIVYNNDNKKEVYNFIEYLFNNTNNKKYKFMIYNENTNLNYKISSWNEEYKSYLSER